MKKKPMQISFPVVVKVLCLGLFFLCIHFSGGQETSADGAAAADSMQAAENASDSETAEPFKIKVSVSEVRLDVVVLDKKTGNPITDLTAADFEVSQDGKRQVVLSSVYINSQPDAAGQPSPARKDAPYLPLFPTAALKKEDVRRTIVFVVDDYALSFENSYYTKMALRNFVEKQMQTGDLVAFVRTDYGNSALNMFQFDKREALARINAFPATMAPRLGDDANTFGVGEGMWSHFLVRRFENQVSTLSYSIRSLENMPGRKVIIMATPFSVPDYNTSITNYIINPPQDIFSLLRIQDRVSRMQIDSSLGRRLLENTYKKLADEALRAGVVVNYLDMDGLYNFKSNYGDASRRMSSSDGVPNPQEDLIERLKQVRIEPFSTPNPIPAQTGGVVIRDGNFFLEGIGKEAESLMRGYYLVSYIPPQDTFETRGKHDDLYRRLKISVKRKDAVVHTRSGFFGRQEREPDAGAPIHPLVEAIYSPYQQDDINVNMAAGYIKDAEEGYLVRSWIHLDPGDVKIVETEDGGRRIDLEALCLASDINGNIQFSKSVGFSLSQFDAAWVRRHGIRFSMLLPVKKPGFYYVRTAVQDKESGRVGSAYQFLEISDLGKKTPALSSIFTINGMDDLDWMRPDMSGEVSEGIILSMFQDADVRSPALRNYAAGDKLQTLAMLYNVDPKAIERSEIEILTILYKDGKEFMRGEAMPITPDIVDNTGSISLLNKFSVGSNMPPGEYLLQLLVTEKKNGKKKENIVYQTLNFTVAEN